MARPSPPCKLHAPPCPIDAIWTTHDGPNAAAMITGWRFVSAPGTDELLLGRFALQAAYRQTLYFVMDGQGRQLAVGDSSGFLVEADVSYDRGGWQYAGATQNGFTFDANRQGSGAPSGVSYFRNRAYDSRTGRWKQEDPLGVAGGLNLYQFNGNNPATYTDPYGLDTLEVKGGRLQKAVSSLRDNDPEYKAMYDRLDVSSRKYLLISSELEPQAGENDPGFTGFATTNNPNAFPSPVLSDEFQKYWDLGATAGAMIGINSRNIGQTIGHETAHLIGVEEIGRIYKHKDQTPLWQAFPIP